MKVIRLLLNNCTFLDSLSESVTKQTVFFIKGRFRVGLGERKYCLVSIKSNKSIWKVPTIYRNKRVCVRVCAHVRVCVFFYVVLDILIIVTDPSLAF